MTSDTEAGRAFRDSIARRLLAAGYRRAAPPDTLRAAVEALADERAAKKVAADAADRFRDVLSECLGHEEENPGDDALVAEVREHFGKSGPEPTRWRDFCAGALAQLDQIAADRALLASEPVDGNEGGGSDG